MPKRYDLGLLSCSTKDTTGVMVFGHFKKGSFWLESDPWHSYQGPSGFDPLQLRFLFECLLGPIWACGLCSQSCWNPFEKPFGPKSDFRRFIPCRHKTLSNPILANLVFIRFRSEVFTQCILAYLGLWPLSTILLEPLWEAIWAHMKF